MVSAAHQCSFHRGIFAAMFFKQMGDSYCIESGTSCRYVSRFDPDYPDKLRMIPDPPAGIYVRGSLPDPGRPAVAIIGSRICSQYGRLAAMELGEAMALADVQVISGLARGIDCISQAAAVRAGGRSFGILGCGVNVVYPAQNKSIFDEVLVNGGLISEVNPDAPPLKAYFAERNRIISALCDILVVVEAKERSGTQITVRHALEQGKDIFAVPGRMNDVCSQGCNALISQGAGIICSPESVLNALGIYPPDPPSFFGKKNEEIKISRVEQRVLDNLDLYPMSLQKIARLCAMTEGEVLTALFHLQFSGLARETGKNHFMKTGG